MNKKTEAILKINEAFYDAFARSDYQTMDALWARDHEVAVIHPGWDPLHGRDAVMDSWRRILAGPPSPGSHCKEAIAYVMTETAFVICTECLPEVDLVATNVFVKEQGEWRQVHHQAGPIPQSHHEMPTGQIH